MVGLKIYSGIYCEVLAVKLVVQRVKESSVSVDGKTVASIAKGLMVLVGFGVSDDEEIADIMANRLLKLRIFPDTDGRMNLSVCDIGGSLLLVPQFTLYASTKKHRPSFHKAMNPTDASQLFDYFCDKCSEDISVERGVFGAYMEVSLVNDGPVTIELSKD